MVSQPSASELSESLVIERITDLLAGQIIGQTGRLEDDAYFDPQKRLILTTDMLVEGTHFRLSTHSPADIGWKAAAVNISDIAAMGGRPNFLLISLGLPNSTTMKHIDGIYQGLSLCAKTYGALIVGGDTVYSPQLTINVTAVGSLPDHHTLGRRNGAKAGDRVMVTGPHGLSSAGLHALEKGVKSAPDSLLQAHRRPTPRVDQAVALSKRISHFALMDTSDGLADACLKIAAQSRVQFVLEETRLPVHPDLAQFAEKTKQDAMSWMLYGGEDFELVATMPIELPLPEGWIEVGRTHKLSEGSSANDSVFLHRPDGTMLPIRAEKTFGHFHSL